MTEDNWNPEDENSAPPSLPRDPQLPPTEGVRIIGAREAGEAAAAGEVDGGAPRSTEASVGQQRASFPESPSVSASSQQMEPESVTEIPAVAPSESFVLPHYSDPPTGQVPKVVIGEESDASWSSLSDQPRWRDTEAQFEADGGLGHLMDDAPKLGALEPRQSSTDFFEAIADLTDTSMPSQESSARSSAAPRGTPSPAPSDDLTDVSDPTDLESVGATGRSQVRTPPQPRRRRPGSTGPGGPRASARGAATTRETASSSRNVPLAAAVGVGLLGVGVLCFKLGAVASMVLIAVVLLACAAEFFTALQTSGYRPQTMLGVLAVGALAVAPLYKAFFAYPIIFGVLTLAGLAWALFVQPGEGSVMNLGVTLLGVAYIGGLGSFATLSLGVARPYEAPNAPNQGIGIVLSAVIITVAYDVCAYFVGRTWGRTPLNAQSPNKTWEGFGGGVAAGLLVSFVIIHFGKLHPVGVDWATTFRFCLICALMAPVGDLCESAIKRDLGVKDMGTLLPGHGGVLDRFDGMLFVLPTAYFMAHFMNLGAPAFF